MVQVRSEELGEREGELRDSAARLTALNAEIARLKSQIQNLQVLPQIIDYTYMLYCNIIYTQIGY